MGEVVNNRLIVRDMVRTLNSMLWAAMMLLLAACGGANGATSEPEQQASTTTIVDTPIEDNEEATGDALRAERVVISKQAMSLKLYDADNHLICRFPVAIGRSYGNKQEEGDMRTPEGEFRIEQIQPATHWVHDVGEGLIEGYYGDWFVRLDTPHRGIGIHGTNDPSSIGGRTTEGCVRLANSDLDSLRPMLKVGMAVTIEPAPSDRKANGEVVIESGQARAVITETIEGTESAKEPVNDPANEATIAENPKPQPSNNKAVETRAEEVWLTVADGELLGRIARSYGVTLADIKRLNPDIDVDRISIGQRIRISDGTNGVTRTEESTTIENTIVNESSAAESSNSEGEVWYTIAEGDLVGRVAARYGTTAKRVAELNPDINIDRVSIGQRIRIK